MTTTMLDKAAIKKKYADEREKRLRPDGNAQYQRLERAFRDLATDPHTPWVERDPVTDHVTFAFVGGGFAGLVVGARLREAGVRDVRIIEKGGDVGGTWYWNRYPGAQCDTMSMIYLPLLEETGHIPSERYAHATEIRRHCVRIAKQFGLYEHALFHTEVIELEWLEPKKCWRVQTNRGDDFTAKYVGMGTGPLHVAKLPGIEGVERFRGKSFHTSRWDYAYTGGDGDGAPMDRLGDKRVAIIGTGATAVQCVPHLAKAAKRLFVFQRTPSSVDVRDNRPIDPAWFRSIATPGWQQRWYDNFVENQSQGTPTEDYIMDGWTEISRRIREAILRLPPSEWTPENMLAAFEDADLRKMEEIRDRVDAIVDDKETAQKLKAWYQQLCKRPCFHDSYLQAFNEPTTELVDTDGKGVERISETGVWANGRHYEVDCIVYASGFEVGTDYTLRAGFDLKGRGGRRLSEHWQEGMRTLHGLHIHGFPNAFMVQPNQAGNLVSNVPHNIVDHAKTIAAVVSHAEAEGFAEVEPTQDAEAAWVSLILGGNGSLLGSPDCTPGYYNNEGQGYTGRYRQAQGFPGGAKAFFEHMERWRASGTFEGLRFGNDGTEDHPRSAEMP
ncbi:MAG: NAD(P)/FAD-dependent oxidoreductase [Alphaproteobacteria bacterium]|nr:NAD(P)/FAD-dependent oxidoreductase [Alphaproteobacteria bacterium]